MIEYSYVKEKIKLIKNQTEEGGNTALLVGNVMQNILDFANSHGSGGGGGDADNVTYTVQNTHTEGTVGEALTELENAVFQLEVGYSTSNAGTFEVGTSVIPTAAFSIVRKGVDVSADAIITITPSATISDDNKSFVGTEISSGSVTYNAEVTVDGQTKSLPGLTYSFTNYRYRGMIDAVPADYPTAIKALSTKELTTNGTLGSTALDANKYYLFAVKGTVTLVCRHASTDGIIGGCVTGTCIVTQENDPSKSNTYSYILVPASTSLWNFKITNA